MQLQKNPLCYLPAILITLGITLGTLPVRADFLDNNNLQESSNLTLNLVDELETEFLPVHEAYQLQLSVDPERLTLDWTIAPDYFLYGDQFHFDLTQNKQLLEIEVSRKKGEVTYDDYFERDVEKFYRHTSQTLVIPQPVSQTPHILSVRFQGCAEAGLCYPPETLHYRIDFSKQMASVLSANPENALEPDSDSFIDSSNTNAAMPPDKSFAVMFIFAVVGGLILNLMPCVFPVLSIKLLSFVSSNQSDSHIREHSWFYTFGVLTTFLLIALLLMLLRQSGAAIGWGFQLQSPTFIGLLALLFLVLGLSLSDVITLGTRFMGVGQQLTTGNHYRNSFFTGVLAVVVASPCSVPFMGVALGYALTQPIYAALIIFAGLGLGLALPFLLFAYIPGLIRFLPKPGPWMSTLKHWFALPLYLTTVWLLWVLFHQINADAIETNASHPGAEKYSEQKLNQYRQQGEAVFINLTADWCITCIVNERSSLSSKRVQQSMSEQKIRYLVGDWTNGDTEVTALLEKHQRGGVPLYLFYDSDGSVQVLPQILTEKIVLSVIEQK